MPLIANILLATATLLTLLLSSIVILSGPRIKLNRLLFIELIAVVLWLVTNIATNLSSSPEIALLFARSTMIGGALIPFVFLLFTYELCKRKLGTIKTFIAAFPVLILLSSTPFGLNIYSVGSYGADTRLGEVYLLLIVVYVLYFGRSLQLIKDKAKNTRLTSSERSQAKVIFLGIVLSLIPALLTNAILPFLDITSALYYGPFSIVFLVTTTTYAIVRHRLFNIRLIIARTVAYLGVLSVLLSIYAIGGFLFARYVQTVFDNEFYSEITLFISSIIVAILYSPLKTFFDKLTSKLFYQDKYDPQALIDRLNQTLVTNVELETLLTKAALIIQEDIKVTYCTFYIRPTSYFKERIIGAHRSKSDFKNIEDIQKIIPKIRRKVFSTEEHQFNDTELQLNTLLRQDEVELMARLVNTVDYEVKGIGYIFMGPKKSGSPYTKNDLKIIEIIANELVIAIENVLRFEEIEQFNVTLQKKIDDATKELKQTNEKLRALDEAKDEFVSMASHQLRTPLTSIKGYLSMVLEGDAGKVTPTQKDMLGQAFFSSQRMVYLISDLLNVSRLKTGKFLIEPKPVYLPNLVEDEINQLQEGAKAKNLTLAFSKPKEMTTMNLDDMKIRQVVMNFTDNAIYYTPSGGKITVELKETEKAVEFRVKDSGIGVPKDEQPKLFTKFYRANNARKARPDGTGLGLFMAKKVIIAQGGAVIFESKEGKGSTFGFSFPKEKLAIQDTKSD